VDFDWKLHLTLSSDTVSQQREPLVILSLFLAHDNETRSTLVLELSKEDLDTFIAQLESVNAELINLKYT